MSRIGFVLAASALVCLWATVQAQPTPPQSQGQSVAKLVKALDDPEEKTRSEAVQQLRLLARKVDRMGGSRVQRGEAFAPKVAGLVPHLVRAAEDKAEEVRVLALFALADTLDVAAVTTLRERIKDPSAKVRLVAACLLTEFQDASGLLEMRAALKRLQKSTDDLRYFDAERVLSSLQRITGKSFGDVPFNPLLSSDSRVAESARQRYQELLDAWVAWWEWTPPKK
jgi:hypothetical protein